MHVSHGAAERIVDDQAPLVRSSAVGDRRSELGHDLVTSCDADILVL